MHHPHATAAAEGVSLSVKALQSPDPQSAVGTTTAQRGQLLEFSYEHVWINVHQEAGGLLPLPSRATKPEEQHMCNTVVSALPFTPNHTTAPHQCYHPRENRPRPICQCVLDRFIYFLLPHPSACTDHITSLLQTTSYSMHLSRRSFSSQRHQPCYSRSMASPPPATVGLWQQPFAFLSVWRKATC